MKKVTLTQVAWDNARKKFLAAMYDSGEWGFADETGSIVEHGIDVGDGDDIDWDRVEEQVSELGYELDD